MRCFTTKQRAGIALMGGPNQKEDTTFWGDALCRVDKEIMGRAEDTRSWSRRRGGVLCVFCSNKRPYRSSVSDLFRRYGQ